MATRDDSVIRGALIASLIVLVLSLVLNFFLWNWGDTSSTAKANAEAGQQRMRAQLVSQGSKIQILQAIVGVGDRTEGTFEQLKNSTSDDPIIKGIVEQYSQDMAVFSPEIPLQNRSYQAMPEFFTSVIRSRNDQYDQARLDAVRTQKERDDQVKAAQEERQRAETEKSQISAQMREETQKFNADRKKIEAEKDTLMKDLNAATKSMEAERETLRKEIRKKGNRISELSNTILLQKEELNRLRRDEFEVAQGEIIYVYSDGKTVQIDLGTANRLKDNAIFQVLDTEASRVSDAKVKATIEVTDVQGNIATCRVIDLHSIGNPVIRGDRIYSPFWSPNSVTQVALAGNIDIDRDGHPDNDRLRGMLSRVGAETIDVMANDNQLHGGVRFLVIDHPSESDSGEELSEKDRANFGKMNKIKARASELGITLLPTWKLMNWLNASSSKSRAPLGRRTRPRRGY